ncbi:MAG: hypothetical protein IJM73_03360 [Spirochaetales bacterium]|nr:hypothetical protein [Spirochaetales bacterium]
MGHKSFLKHICTVSLAVLLSLFIMVSCAPEPEPPKPQEINAEQTVQVEEIASQVSDGDLTLEDGYISLGGHVALSGNASVRTTDLYEFKDLALESGLTLKLANNLVGDKYKLSLEADVDRSTANLNITGPKTVGGEERVTKNVTAAISYDKDNDKPEGTLTIGGFDFDVSQDIDGDLVIEKLGMDLDGILDGEGEPDMDKIMDKAYGKVKLTLSNIGVEFKGHLKDASNTPVTIKAKIDGTVEPDVQQPDAVGKRAANLKADLVLSIDLEVGEGNIEFKAELTEDLNVEDLNTYIEEFGDLLDDALDTPESLQHFLDEVGLTFDPFFASVNGVEVEAKSFVNVVIGLLTAAN